MVFLLPGVSRDKTETENRRFIKKIFLFFFLIKRIVELETVRTNITKKDESSSGKLRSYFHIWGNSENHLKKIQQGIKTSRWISGYMVWYGLIEM